MDALCLLLEANTGHTLQAIGSEEQSVGYARLRKVESIGDWMPWKKKAASWSFQTEEAEVEWCRELRLID